MATEQTTATLGNLLIALIDHRGRTPKKLGGEFSHTGIPVLSAKNIKDGQLTFDQELRFVTPEMHDQWMPEKLRAGDVLLTSEAPLGEVVYLKENAHYCLGQRLFALRADPQKLDSRFLYYLLRSDLVQHRLRARATGTTAQGVRQSELVKVQLEIPPLREQRAVAHILGTLDDKIESNRRMNETLEAMARAIFRSWFVDFDPVRAKAEGRQPYGMDGEAAALFPDSFEDSALGKIPKGWRVRGMAELVSLSRTALDPVDFPAETFDHYSIPAFDEGRWPKEEAGGTIKSHKLVVPRDAVLLSKLNPRLPRVWLPAIGTNRRSIASTEFLVALPRLDFSREYVFALFGSQAFLHVFESLVTGTSGSHQRVRADFLLAMDALVPTLPCVETFTRFARPLLGRAAKNLVESRTLAAIRNGLLPKLISGEIRVKDAEQVQGTKPRRVEDA